MARRLCQPLPSVARHRVVMRTRMLRVLSGCGLLLAFGCAGGPHAPEPSPNSQSIVKSPSTTPSAPSETLVSRGLRSAIDAGVVTPTARIPRGQQLIALGSAGEEAVVASPTPARGVHFELVLKSGQVQPIPIPAGPDAAGQVTNAAISEKYVVWAQTKSRILEKQSETIAVYDRSSGVSRVLLRRPASAPVPGYTGPQILGGYAYAVVPMRQGRSERGVADFGVVRLPLTAPAAPREVRRGAAFVSASGNTLAYVLDRAGVERVLVYRWEQVGQRLDEIGNYPLARSAVAFIGLAVTDQWVAWITAGAGHARDSITVQRLESGQRWKFDAQSPAECLGYPHLGQDFAVWSNGACSTSPKLGSYLMTLSSGKVYMLGETIGLYATWAVDSTVAWQEATGPGPRDVDVRIGAVASQAR